MNLSLPEWLKPLADTLAPWFPLLTVTGIAMAVASSVLIPVLLVKMPEDYFSNARHRPPRVHGPLDWVIWSARNALASVLLVAGVLMLLLPGQGLLTILVALIVSSFPGKYRVERAIIRRPGIFQAVNWIRQRYDKPPLKYPDGEPGEPRC